MRKWVGLCLTLLIVLASRASYAYVIDGNLSDWGVTPFTSWTSASTSSTVDWSGNQNYSGPGNYPHGGEVFDAEAMYFDDDANYIYVAMVVSMGPTGTPYPYGSGPRLLPGDLGIDITSTNADGYPYEYGFGIYNFSGQLMSVTDWSLPHGYLGYPINGPSSIVSGVSLGSGSLRYVNAGQLEGPTKGDTYIIETSIAKSLFSNPLNNGQTVNLHWTMSCGNDVLNVTGDIDNSIPEPSTLLMFLSGLAGFIPLRKRL